jgi:hypothetical protein
MGQLSQALGADGAAHTFIHDGVSYPVSLITQAVKDSFSKSLFAKAKEAARHMRDLMSPEQYERHLERLNDDFISGAYDFESERAAAALHTPSGCLDLCCLLFNAPRSVMIDIAAKQSAELKALLQLIRRESLPEAAQESTDPNLPAATAL